MPEQEDEGPAVAVAVASEFAAVAVAVDTAASGPRLRLPEGHLARLLDPSADRWRDV